MTADGTLTRTDAHNDPELFRALCGGGGNFGVVTAMEFELYPVEELTGGAMLWPQERAEEIFNAWSAWTETLPTHVTSLCRLLNVPPLPDVPEPLRGRSFVVVEAAILGDDAILAPLRALEPELDMVGPIPPAALIEIHNDPKQPMPGLADHRVLADATPGGDREARAAPRAPSWSRSSCATSAATCRSAASACSRSACRWTPSPRWRSTARWPA